MHSFQPATIDILELNPFDKIGKEWMLLTAGNKDKVNTMTAAWGGLGVVWNKNIVNVYVRDSRYTKEFIDREKTFSLSFPGEKYRREMKFLGAVSGRDEDKIKGAGINIDFDEGIPFIDEANLVLICKVLSATKIDKDSFVDDSIADFYEDGDYHTMYIAEITKVLAR